jgi:hypothetical protein
LTREASRPSEALRHDRPRHGRHLLALPLPPGYALDASDPDVLLLLRPAARGPLRSALGARPQKAFWRRPDRTSGRSTFRPTVERPGMDRGMDLVTAGGAAMVLALDRDRHAQKTVLKPALEQDLAGHGCGCRRRSWYRTSIFG